MDISQISTPNISRFSMTMAILRLLIHRKLVKCTQRCRHKFYLLVLYIMGNTSTGVNHGKYY